MSAQFCQTKVKSIQSRHFKIRTIWRLCFKKRLQMSATIITTEDLREFKMELIDDIKQLLNNQSGNITKKWMKSPEVRELLSISSGTLQNFRINGTLPYTKIGGVIYYDYQEILQVMEVNKIHNKIK